jgi:hypothetical protein
MNNQIQSQAARVWGIVKDPATGATYTQTAATTWLILKETGYLLWLVVCLTLVFGDWLWRTGYRTGWSTREWINNFEKPDTDRVVQDAGQGLLEASKAAFSNAIATAKSQLGIEDRAEPLFAGASAASTSLQPRLQRLHPHLHPRPHLSLRLHPRRLLTQTQRT